jgi:hypothetical protein
MSGGLVFNNFFLEMKHFSSICNTKTACSRVGSYVPSFSGDFDPLVERSEFLLSIPFHLFFSNQTLLFYCKNFFFPTPVAKKKKKIIEKQSQHLEITLLYFCDQSRKRLGFLVQNSTQYVQELSRPESI